MGGIFSKVPQCLPRRAHTLPHNAKFDITDAFPHHDKESMWTMGAAVLRYGNILWLRRRGRRLNAGRIVIPHCGSANRLPYRGTTIYPGVA